MAEPIWSPSDIPWHDTSASRPAIGTPLPLIAPPAPRGCHHMFMPPMAFPMGYRRSLLVHANLLDRLLGGYVPRGTKISESIYVCAGSPKLYGNMVTWVRLEDLTWRYEPGSPGFAGDFVALVQLRFSLERERSNAWGLAVALLRRAYARDLVTVEALVQRGDALRAAGTRASGKASKEARDALTEAREAFSDALHTAMGRDAT
ncbi:hypothetical protein [Magnetospirillum sp. 15-1]|uniref:hypothetical protein n=1 Tax=Magnetospirillum sp. 15-1 TaxID=1979370 RepID=UPI000BBC4F2A|nr:hypothetical protein [Magnetospirillum sp. 15-1]